MKLPLRRLLFSGLLGLPAWLAAQESVAPRFSWTPHVTGLLPTQLGEDQARIRTTRAGLDVGGIWGLSERLQFGLETGLTYNHYHFRRFEQILNLPEAPLRDAFALRLAPSLIYGVNDRWSLVGGTSVGFNGDAEASAADSLILSGYAGARRQFNERFALTFGVFATTLLEESVRVLPLIGVEWQISEKWRLATQGAGGQLGYQLNPPLRLFLGMNFESRDFRLDAESSIPKGVVRDESFPISLGLEWKPSPTASLTVQAGNAFGRTIEFNDRDGRGLAEEEVDGSMFVALALRVGFVGDPRQKPSKEETSSLALKDSEGCCRGGVLQLWEENDSVTGTDHNYTQGLRISWLAPEYGLGEVPGWMHWFAEGLPSLGYDVDRVRWGVTLGQNIFTPDDISIAALQPDDRPYAATIYAAPALQRRGTTPGGIPVLEEVRVDLGWMGPGALGGEAQNFIHRNWKIGQAKGWANQVRNEPLGSISLARAWRVGLGGNRDEGAVEWLPYLGLAGGTPKTHGAVGSILRVGFHMPDDFGQPTIRSILPSSGGGATSGFGVQLFAGLEVKGVARDSTIEGNLWKESHHLEAVPWSVEGRLGLAFTWRRVDLGFSYNYETREYSDQDHNHNYGSLWMNWRI